MKKRVNIKNIKDKTIHFILNNKLFFAYVVLSVLLGLVLRIITIHGHIYFKSIVADLFVTLIIGSFSFFMKEKYRFGYYLGWLIFNSLICIGNNIYYGFYQSFLSINLISTASMVSQVNDALFAKIHLYHFAYLIIPLIYILFKKYIVKDEHDKLKGLLAFKRIYIVIVLLFLFLISTFNKIDASRFIKLWNRESVVSKYGIYVYTANDLVQSIIPRINTLFGYDEAAYEFREFYSCKAKKESNEYTDLFKGKNVLFIHAESIQNFLINLKINNKEVTPNINKLAKEGIYFSKFYPQISIGTSSDTEFTLLTGLMPSSTGTVFVNYADREYKGMPEYFNNLGYYTFSMHANNVEYWNRQAMHTTLGYKNFYFKDKYIIPEDSESEDYVGLGLSDKAFFKQSIPFLKNIKENNSPFFGTIITLSNHLPFNDIEKYGDFDVTLDYTYINEYGRREHKDVNYLNDTVMGNYIKSSHYADEAIGELFKDLKKNNLLDNTIIVFYGDHEARLVRKEFDRLYNYDPETDDIIDSEDEDYYDVYGYNYDLLKNTPLIIWSNDNEFNTRIDKVMGMYDVLPTIANMFGFKEKYSLGHDIFDSNEGIVVFPNGNVLTDKVYYSDLNDEYITFTSEPIEIDYIDKLKEYANNILAVSNGIVTHDLIKNESNRIGECKK